MSQYNPSTQAQLWLQGSAQGAQSAQFAQRQALAMQELQTQERYRQQQAALQQQQLAQQAGRDDLARQRFGLDRRAQEAQAAMLANTQGMQAGRAEQMGMFRTGDPMMPQSDPMAYQQFAGADPVSQRQMMELEVNEKLRQDAIAKQVQFEQSIRSSPYFTDGQKKLLLLNAQNKIPASAFDMAFDTQAAPVTAQRQIDPGIISALVPDATPDQVAAGVQVVAEGGTIGQALQAVRFANPRKVPNVNEDRAALRAEMVQLEAMLRSVGEIDPDDMQVDDAAIEAQNRQRATAEARLVQIKQQLAYLDLGITPPGAAPRRPQMPGMGQTQSPPISELPQGVEPDDSSVVEAWNQLGSDAPPERVYQLARAIAAMRGGQ